MGIASNLVDVYARQVKPRPVLAVSGGFPMWIHPDMIDEVRDMGFEIIPQHEERAYELAALNAEKQG